MYNHSALKWHHIIIKPYLQPWLILKNRFIFFSVHCQVKITYFSQKIKTDRLCFSFKCLRKYVGYSAACSETFYSNDSNITKLMVQVLKHLVRQIFVLISLLDNIQLPRSKNIDINCNYIGYLSQIHSIPEHPLATKSPKLCLCKFIILTNFY